MSPILVLTYWSYKDALIQTYTLPYVKIVARVSNRKIYLVCLEQPHIAASALEKARINVELRQHNIEVVFFNYHRFGVVQMLRWTVYLAKLLYLIVKERIGYLHAWAMSAGAMGYILSVVTGRPLILDSYEPHAEAMAENGTWARDSSAYKILFELEKRQSQRAAYFIAAASGMINYAERTYHLQIDRKRFFTKPACTDLENFKFNGKDEDLMTALDLKGKIVCVYSGKLGGIYLDNEVFDFFKQCFLCWGERFKILLLTNSPQQIITDQLRRVEIPENSCICRFVWHQDIPKYLSLADFALTPVKPVPTKRYCTPIKDGEYWAMGLPVVITSGISDDSDIIEENNAGYVLKDLSDKEYLRAVKKIDELLTEDVNTLRSRIEALASKYRNFTIAENVYRAIYNH